MKERSSGVLDLVRPGARFLVVELPEMLCDGRCMVRPRRDPGADRDGRDVDVFRLEVFEQAQGERADAGPPGRLIPKKSRAFIDYLAAELKVAGNWKRAR